ncbi:MAG: DNA repair and recombination protein RadB [Nanoarchaeota archaeon]|nr:DNA repair and recombination protein RadB [Nanoarchaeota archaeon]
MTEFKISSGSQDIDNWINSGYDKDIITTIYGPAGSGKTNFCMLATVQQVKNSNKVIFIDTEGGFSTERFKQIAGENYQQLMKNVLLLKPTSFQEQKKNFEILLKELNQNSNINLIIVDGMTMLYRLELSDAIQLKNDFKIQTANRELARQLRTLAEISRKKNIPVIITNQVYYDFLKQDDFFKPQERQANMVGGDLLKYWSKCHIELKFHGGKRTAVLKKHRSIPEKELSFIIVNSGIKKRGIF